MAARESYSFTVHLQTLKGLSPSSSGKFFGVAWRKGSRSGASARVACTDAGEVALNASIAIESSVQRDPVTGRAVGDKQLFELHVKEYPSLDDKHSRVTIGVLFLDLAMHVPKQGGGEVKQAACLPVSNTHPVKLQLTIHSKATPGEPEKAPEGKGPSKANTILKKAAAVSSDDRIAELERSVRELQDENLRLKRQNDALKVEDSYTWSNNPVRGVKTDEQMEQLRAQIKDLKEELSVARAATKEAEEKLSKAKEEAERELAGAVAKERHQREHEISEMQKQLDASSVKSAAELLQARRRLEELGREHREEVAALEAELQRLRAPRRVPTAEKQVGTEATATGTEQLEALRSQSEAVQRELREDCERERVRCDAFRSNVERLQGELECSQRTCEELTRSVETLQVKYTQKKRCAADLKRFLYLHLHLKQVMQSGEPSDLDGSLGEISGIMG